MRQHHPLGKAGGAAGIKDPRQILARAKRIGCRGRAGDQILIGMHAAWADTIAGEDNLLHRGALLGDGRADLGEGVVNHQEPRPGVVDRVHMLGQRPANVHRHHIAAGPKHPVVIFGISVGVKGQHRDTVLDLQPKVVQATGQTGDTVKKLGPGEPAIGGDQRRCVRHQFRRAAQPLGHVHRRKPSHCRYSEISPFNSQFSGNTGVVAGCVEETRQGLPADIVNADSPLIDARIDFSDYFGQMKPRLARSQAIATGGVAAEPPW